MASQNTAAHPICPCRRSAASPSREAAPGPAPSHPGTEKRSKPRTRSAAAFALPSIALALVPKCPMCIAAYLAIGGGLGVSLSTAAHLRTAIVWLCWSVLVLLAARVAMRLTIASVLRARLKPILLSLLSSTVWSTLRTRA